MDDRNIAEILQRARRAEERLAELERKETPADFATSIDAAAMAMHIIPFELPSVLVYGARKDASVYSRAAISGIVGTLTGTWTATIGPGAYQQFSPGNYVSFNDTASIESVNRPLFCGWVYFDNAATSIETVFSKWGTLPQTKTQRLYRSATGILTYEVSRDGNTVAAALTDGAIPAQTWKFVVANYEFGTGNVYLHVNGVTFSSGSGGTGALKDSSSSYVIGAGVGGAEAMTGRIGLPWFVSSVGTAYSTDVQSVFSGWFTRTRAAFGV